MIVGWAMSIYSKLSQIQTRLKCNKNQYNSYGGFKYRSQEDILEAVKPILSEVGALVLTSDEICASGDRIYIKATARLIDIESGKEVSAVAFAREPKEKRGMDESQITGSASSYARKYALNGLFAIDDVKDSDADVPGPDKITLGQIKLIKAIVADETALCEYYKVKKIEELTKEQANEIIRKKGNKRE